MGGARKMNATLAVRAQQMRDAGTPITVIAEEFGVTGQTIRNWTTAAGQSVAAPVEVAPVIVTRKPALVAKRPVELGRWRVVRARGEFGSRLGNGWFTSNGLGSGAWFPTWSDAWASALSNARRENREALETAALNGLMKARARSAA